MRNQTLIVLLATAALGGAAHAQNRTHYTCNDGLPGYATCRDSNGDSYTVHTDSFGTTVTGRQPLTHSGRRDRRREHPGQ